MYRTTFRIILSTGAELVRADGSSGGPEEFCTLSYHRSESAARRALADHVRRAGAEAPDIYLQRRSPDGSVETEVRGEWRYGATIASGAPISK